MPPRRQTGGTTSAIERRAGTDPIRPKVNQPVVKVTAGATRLSPEQAIQRGILSRADLANPDD